MQSFLLILHNLLRWIVVILAILAAGRALIGWLGRKQWTQMDDRLGLFYTISLDVQLLVGLILWILYLLALSNQGNLGNTFSNSVQRFFTIEHFLIMLIGVALAHVGRSRSKKAATDESRFKQAAIWFILSILVILAGVPWPFLEPHGRPWFRF